MELESRAGGVNKEGGYGYESQFNNWDTVLVRPYLCKPPATLSPAPLWLYLSQDLLRRRAIHDFGPAGLLPSEQIQMVR